MYFASIVIALTCLASIVNAHGLITAVQGANGVTGQGFGVDNSVPRDGSSPVPFEGDTTKFSKQIQQATAGGGGGGAGGAGGGLGGLGGGRKGGLLGRAGADPCGSTKLGGVNDVATEMAKTMSAGVPTAGADGTVTMTIHQVNQDGAGPYTCDMDPTGTGTGQFVAMDVSQNVPGKNVPVIGSLSTAKATDFPVQAQIPAGTQCTGGGGGVCLIRCMNAAIAGPFGGCAAIAQGNATTPAIRARDMQTEGGKAAAIDFAKRWLRAEKMRTNGLRAREFGN